MARKALGSDGEWREGPAAPKLLPAHLRDLPGEVLATDSDDPDRITEDDAPHIVRSLAKEHVKSVTQDDDPDLGEEVRKLYAPKAGERAPITQWYVDVAKARVGLNLLQMVHSLMARPEMDAVAGMICQDILDGFDPPQLTWHLVFPDPYNVNEYALRKGPRPKRDPLGNKWARTWRDIDTDIKPFSPPRSVVSEMKSRGIDFDPRQTFIDAFVKGSGDESLIIT